MLSCQFSFMISINTVDPSKVARKTVKILIRWLLMKPTDLDLHYLFTKKVITGFSRTRVNPSHAG